MKHYQAVRISINGRATYGDRYQRISSYENLSYHQIVEIGNEKFLILFQEEC